MTSSNETKKEHFGMFEDMTDKLSNPVVIGGVLVIIILIIVAVVMWQKESRGGGGVITETAGNVKYLLSNTPELDGYN